MAIKKLHTSNLQEIYFTAFKNPDNGYYILSVTLCRTVYKT